LGPAARWKQASSSDIWQRVRWPLAFSVAAGLLLPLLEGWTWLIALGLFLAAWVITTSIQDLRKRIAGTGTLSQRLRTPSRSYYGMLMAHLGIAVFIIGVTMVKGYETERDVRMDVGDTVVAGGFEFRFDGVSDQPGPNYMAAQGRVTVRKDGKVVTVLQPEKRVYSASGMPMTEASIEPGLLRDLYVSLGEPIPGTTAWAVRVYIKPFVDWIWLGCLMMALGGIFAISDRRYRIHARKAQAAAKGVEQLKEKTA
jgi:cytochrome c-type biogenesis protein CcmF